MEYGDGVIVITPNGEVISSGFDEINPRHLYCFIDIENRLNLNIINKDVQIEHAWALAQIGIISFQIVKDINYIIVSPETDIITPVQLEKMYEIIKNNFSDVNIFGVDLVSNNGHKAIEVDGKYEFGLDELNKVFNFGSLENHKTR